MRDCDYEICILDGGPAGMEPAHTVARLRCRDRDSDNSLWQLCASHQRVAAHLLGAMHLYPAMMQSNRFVADGRMQRQLTAGTGRRVQRLLRLRGTHG